MVDLPGEVSYRALSESGSNAEEEPKELICIVCLLCMYKLSMVYANPCIHSSSSTRVLGQELR